MTGAMDVDVVAPPISLQVLTFIAVVNGGLRRCWYFVDVVYVQNATEKRSTRYTKWAKFSVAAVLVQSTPPDGATTNYR